MNKAVLFLLTMATAFATQAAQTTHLFTGFEYESEPAFLLESVELNGATGQIGVWSGDDFPEALADGFFSGGFLGGDSVGFVDHPLGGRVLSIDGPIDSAVHFMNLNRSTPTDGAEVSFSVGSLRSGVGGRADFDLFGLDQNGNESFRVRIGADTDKHRLGFVSNGGATFDFPTTHGFDQANDLAPVSLPLTSAGNLADVTLLLDENGYSMDVSNLNGANSYRTSLLPYNGSATQLTQIGLFYRGFGVTSNQQSGLLLDDLMVTSGGVSAELFNGYINADNKIVLRGTGEEVVALNFESPKGLLVPVSEAGDPIFTTTVVNTPNNISVGSIGIGKSVAIDGELVTAVGYRGDSPESDLLATWGDTSSIAHEFTVSLQSGVGLDCNGDGIVDSNDLSCACSDAQIEPLLATLNLLPGDLDANGEVSFLDFLSLASNFGQPGEYSDGDIDCSGEVSFLDFLTLASNFGKSSAVAAAVPEPNSGALFVFGMILAFATRVRVRG